MSGDVRRLFFDPYEGFKSRLQRFLMSYAWGGKYIFVSKDAVSKMSSFRFMMNYPHSHSDFLFGNTFIHSEDELPDTYLICLKECNLF